MASVTFKRTNNIDSVPITDGQLIFDTSDQKIYLDNGNTREVYGGGSGTDLISNVSDATDNNAFNANATVNLFTRKSSIVDTKAEIQSVTQAGVPLGCKGFNEVIGTGDISALGDGSVTGAILANKSAIDTVNQNLTCRYNPTNDYVQLYDGTQWLDWKRGYLQAFKIFTEGVQDVTLDLVSSNFPTTVSSHSNVGNWVITDNVVKSITQGSNGQYLYTAFGTYGKIDLTDYRTLHVTLVDGTDYPLDIQSYSGLKCLMFLNTRWGNGTIAFGVTIGDSKNVGSGFPQYTLVQNTTNTPLDIRIKVIYLTK